MGKNVEVLGYSLNVLGSNKVEHVTSDGRTDLNNFTFVNILRQRSSGILLPIFSLPGADGIGDIGPSALGFIDFLKKSGQHCWQVLPLGPTSPLFGNSPYMSPSAFAGSPLLISLDLLVEQGLLLPKEKMGSFSEYTVDYPRVERYKNAILNLAWQRFLNRPNGKTLLAEFAATHSWCVDYGLFLALKQQFRGAPWFAWPMALRQRHVEPLAQAVELHKAHISRTLFEQYIFFTQWRALRQYAADQGISLIGDLPMYVALDSADVWANQEVFFLDKSSGEPTYVAGVPPDYFSATGQRWGNPLYRWETTDPQVRQSLWNWWEQRLQLNFSLVDILRIDHFRGFASYWSIPATEQTALNGTWREGPGLPFFEEMTRRLGDMPIIAEDLGLITPDVESLLRQLGYPGMNVLLFAFDGDPNNNYLPYNIQKNSVVYSGTHDNDTAVGWYLNPEISTLSKQRAKRFANRTDDDAGSFHRDLVHLALASPANLAILPMQDVLGFGNDCRLNTPGTVENNWQWRCAPRFIHDELAAWLYNMTELFGRLPSLKRKDTSDTSSGSLNGL